MDLRSIKPGLAAVSHPLFMIHPQSGDMITPLGWTKRGAPVWPMMGGAPDDDEGNKGEDDSESDDDDEEDESEEDDDSEDDDDSDDDDEKGKGKKKNAQAKIKALEEEKDRHFRKFKKANKRAEAAEAALAAMKAKYESADDDDDADEDDAKDKGKLKGKKGQSKVPIDDTKVKAAEARAERLAVENAFLRVNVVEWIKPEQALALMMTDDDYDVEFDEDGKVDRKALKAELKRFARENPHLVKPKAAPKDDDKGEEDDDAQRATASKMNGKRKGSKKTDKELTREQLAKKFPALAGRI
jgi:hypothetical protein